MLEQKSEFNCSTFWVWEHQKHLAEHGSLLANELSTQEVLQKFRGAVTKCYPKHIKENSG